MQLTLTSIIVILIGLGLTWTFLFKLFTEKNPRKVGSLLGVLIFFLSPFIAMGSYSIYATISRQWFIMSGSSGEVQLRYSPLKMKKVENYCDQFTDDKNKPINRFTLGSKDIYCGSFWNLDSNEMVFLPYKRLGADKAVYWASPALKIVGPAPEFDQSNAKSEE